MRGRLLPNTSEAEDPLTGEPGVKRRCHVYAQHEGDITRLALREFRSFDQMVNVLLDEAMANRYVAKEMKHAATAKLSAAKK